MRLHVFTSIHKVKYLHQTVFIIYDMNNEYKTKSVSPEISSDII